MLKAIVTGANKGIGLEFCRQLKDLGYDVIGLCRKLSPELKNLKIKIIENVDVKDYSRLIDVYKEIKNPIDLLINNAGIYLKDEFNSLNFKNLEEQFNVNSLGPLKIVSAFMKLLKKDSKVIMISSIAGSITSVQDAKSYGYRSSKAALNMISNLLSFELKPFGVSLGIFHPGYVKTDMTNHQGIFKTFDSVQNMLKLIEKLNSDNSGTFWHVNGEIIPW
jgi:short-subunit dehydrogenase